MSLNLSYLIIRLTPIILLALVSSLNCHGQKSSTEELLAALDTTTSERSRSFIYGQLSMTNIMDFPRGLEYANKSLTASERSGDSLDIANAKFQVAYVYFHNRKLNESIFKFEKAFNYYHELDDLQGLTYTCYYKGYAYSDLGQNYLAVEEFEKGLKIARKSKNPQFINISLNALGPAYCNIHKWDKGLESAEEAVLIAEKEQFNLSSTYNQMALVHQLKGDFSKSLKFFNLSAKNLGPEDNYKNVASDFQNRGEAYLMTAQYDSSLTCYYALLDVAKENNDNLLISLGMRELARFKFELGELQDAKEDIYQSLHLTTQKVDSLKTLDFLIDILIQNNEFDEASEILTLSRSLASQLELASHRITSDNQQGLIFYQKGNYDEAITKHESALRLIKELGSARDLPDTYLFLARAHLSRDSYKTAINYADSSLKISRASNYRRKLDLIYELKSSAAFALGDESSAYQFLKQHQNVKDSLLNIEKNREIAKLQIQYNVKEREAENAILKAEQKSSDAQVKQRTTLSIALVLILLLVSMIAFILIRNVRKKKMQNSELEIEVQKRTKQLITQEKELLEIRQSQSLQEAKAVFFANVSHEFRTPLTLIQGTIKHLISQNDLTPSFKNSLERANRNSKQLNELITEILDITKLDGSGLDITATAIDLKKEVINLHERFVPLANEKKINLAFNLDNISSTAIYSDKPKLIKILSNLLSNALKFTPKKGQITVDFTYNEESVIIEVNDTGVGIPEKALDLVFERFYQVNQDSTNSNKYHVGSGIGLSLCQEYVNVLGGEIWAESPGKLGCGSTFNFTLPLNFADEYAVMSESNRKEAITGNSLSIPSARKLKLLLVDDNYDLASFLKEVLSPLYVVSTAENGQEALEFLHQTDELPSIIVSDVMMPVMDGFSLIEKLKSLDKYRHIPVIMLTARAELRDKMKALRIGVDDYIIKPFDQKDLISRIQQLVGHIENRMVDSSKLTESESRNKVALELSQDEHDWLLHLEQEAFKLITNFNYTAEDLALALNMSRAKFFRQIKRLTGLTVNQYIKEFRLQTARKLLEEDKAHSVKEVSYTVGFKHVNYFSLSFEKRFGKRPSEYINH